MRFGIRARSLAAAMSVALVAAGAIAVAKSKIDAKRSPNVDFSPIKTYVWLPSPPLTLQAAPGTMRDPKVIQAEVEPWIIGTADSALAAHGWKRVTAPPADVQIIYYLSHGTGFNASNIGDYYQAVTGYALVVPPYLAPTQSVVVYEEGTIVDRHRAGPQCHLARHRDDDDQSRAERCEAEEVGRGPGEEADRQVADEVTEHPRPTAAPRVLQVALSLAPGGTERLVVELVRRFSDAAPQAVCCLDSAGSWGEALREDGVEVHVLGKAVRVPAVPGRQHRQSGVRHRRVGAPLSPGTRRSCTVRWPGYFDPESGSSSPNTAG